ARDDHVLLAIRQIEEALTIHMADVASAEPIAEEGRARFLRVLPVAARDLGATQTDLTAFASRLRATDFGAVINLHMRQRPADRADLRDFVPGLHHRVATARFSEAIGIDITCVREVARKCADAWLGCA